MLKSDLRVLLHELAVEFRKLLEKAEKTRGRSDA